MRNIYSNIFKVNNKNLSKAINLLKKKELVGVPTETVYGLAGNAYSDVAVKKIYKFKHERANLAESRILLMEHKSPPPPLFFICVFSWFYAYFRLG